MKLDVFLLRFSRPFKDKAQGVSLLSISGSLLQLSKVAFVRNMVKMKLNSPYSCTCTRVWSNLENIHPMFSSLKSKMVYTTAVDLPLISKPVNQGKADYMGMHIVVMLHITEIFCR